MSAAERRALLGNDVVEQIRQRVALAPALAPDTTEADDLRRILTRPASTTVTARAPRAA